jgi:hypothetical protein
MSGTKEAARRVSWSGEFLVNTCQPHLAGIPNQRSVVAKRYQQQGGGAVRLLFGNRRQET